MPVPDPRSIGAWALNRESATAPARDSARGSGSELGDEFNYPTLPEGEDPVLRSPAFSPPFRHSPGLTINLAASLALSPIGSGGMPSYLASPRCSPLGSGPGPDSRPAFDWAGSGSNVGSPRRPGPLAPSSRCKPL
jgi:hypothetical protein